MGTQDEGKISYKITSYKGCVEKERKYNTAGGEAPSIIDNRRRAMLCATETHGSFSPPPILVQSFHPHQSSPYSPARRKLPEPFVTNHPAAQPRATPHDGTC